MNKTFASLVAAGLLIGPAALLHAQVDLYAGASAVTSDNWTTATTTKWATAAAATTWVDASAGNHYHTNGYTIRAGHIGVTADAGPAGNATFPGADITIDGYASASGQVAPGTANQGVLSFELSSPANGPRLALATVTQGNFIANVITSANSVPVTPGAATASNTLHYFRGGVGITNFYGSLVLNGDTQLNLPSSVSDMLFNIYAPITGTGRIEAAAGSAGGSTNVGFAEWMLYDIAGDNVTPGSGWQGTSINVTNKHTIGFGHDANFFVTNPNASIYIGRQSAGFINLNANVSVASGKFIIGTAGWTTNPTTLADGVYSVDDLNLLFPGIASEGTYAANNFSPTGHTYKIYVGQPVPAAAPTINGFPFAIGSPGATFTYQISATRKPTTYAATGLPAGLSINATTGLISGTPTDEGTSTVSLSATNGTGTGTRTITITIAAGAAPGGGNTGGNTGGNNGGGNNGGGNNGGGNNGGGSTGGTAPAITSAATASATVGTAFTYQIAASSSPTSYAATGLPSGLTVNATSGLISGTPTVAGTATVTLSATNATGTGTATLTITVGLTVPSITSAASAMATVGQAFTYQVVATGSPTLYAATGLPAGLAIDATTGLISGTPTAGGLATVSLSATNTAGTGTATLTLILAGGNGPAITTQPASQTVRSGGTAVLRTGTSASGASYQWYLNGTAVTGATNSTLLTTTTGTYMCLVAGSAGTSATALATLTLSTTTNAGRLTNLSVLTGASSSNVLTVGFVSGGSGTTGQQPVLIRSAGPTLSGFGVHGALADPVLSLFSGGNTTALASNDNWASSAANQVAVAGADASTGAFPFSDTSSLDAALVQSLPPELYTVQVAGKTTASGLTLAEIYDNTPVYTASSPRLINVSSLLRVDANGAVTAGFGIGGSTAATVLIRISGPALAPFGVANVMPDPVLKVYGTQGLLATNAGWGGDPVLASAVKTANAFEITKTSSKDSAVVLTLAPGPYSVQCTSASGAAGTVLIEIYEVR